MDLDNYKLKLQFEKDYSLEIKNTAMKGMTPEDGVGKPEDEYEWLTQIIRIFNDAFL